MHTEYKQPMERHASAMNACVIWIYVDQNAKR